MPRVSAVLLVLLGLLTARPAVAADTGEGWDAVGRGDYGRAVSIFSELAGGGDSEAMFALGWLYSRGEGVDKDSGSAVRWLDDASSLGHVGAQTYLGYLFGLGLGVERDRARAEELDGRAAAAGGKIAINNLAYGWSEAGRNLDKALAMVTPLVNEAPEDSAVLDTFGWILYRMGRIAESLPPLCKAARAEPGHPEILGHLGDALWRAGHAVQARQSWAEAIGMVENRETLSAAGLEFATSQAGESFVLSMRARLAHGLPDAPDPPPSKGGATLLLPDACGAPMS